MIKAYVDTREKVEAKNQLFNDFLIETVEGYRAERWCEIYTNGTDFAILYDERMKNCYGLKTYKPQDISEWDCFKNNELPII